MARVRKQPDERRNEILDMALSLFTEKGFLNVTINDIAKKAGIARTTFYEYYTDKSEILVDVVDRAIKTFIISAPQGDHIYEKLENLAANMLRKIESNRDIYMLIFREAPILSKDVSKKLMKWRYDNMQITQKIMEEAEKSHLLHQDVSIDSAVFVYTAILGQRAGDCLISGETIHAETEAEKLVKIIWRSIAR